MYESTDECDHFSLIKVFQQNLTGIDYTVQISQESCKRRLERISRIPITTIHKL